MHQRAQRRLAAWELHKLPKMKKILTRPLILIALVIVIFAVSAPGFSSAAFAAQRSSKHVHLEDSEVSETPADPFGVGIMLGDLNGVSAKYEMNGRNSFDGGFSYQSGEYATLHADYLWNVAELFGLSPRREKKSAGLLAPYFGIGAILYFDTSKSSVSDPSQLFERLKSSGIALGARVPIGLEYQPSIVPCGIFAEIAPGTILVPGMIGLIQAEVGVRFYM
jgi:hypothetical protein